MKTDLKSKPALILVDFQKAFEDEAYWGGSKNNINLASLNDEFAEVMNTQQLLNGL